jgi:hypothetical protein
MEDKAAHAIEGDLIHLKHLLEAPPEVHQHLQQAHSVWEDDRYKRGARLLSRYRIFTGLLHSCNPQPSCNV